MATPSFVDDSWIDLYTLMKTILNGYQYQGRHVSFGIAGMLSQLLGIKKKQEGSSISHALGTNQAFRILNGSSGCRWRLKNTTWP